jgi:hypothetical protein
MERTSAIGRALLVATLLVPRLIRAQEFHPPCGTIPFEALKEEQDIDSECGLLGDPGANGVKQAENSAKNNFCATGTPANLTFVSFGKLEKKWDAKTKDERKALVADRSGLAGFYTTSDGDTVGEGSVVRVVAFVFHADHSNWQKKSDGTGGESVNCSTPGRLWNDIHVELTQAAPQTGLSKTAKYAAECKSITAEVSPHFRPDAWAPIALTTPDRPLRITGQLFLDNSHTPCQPGKTIHPARQSVWEIHPVYRIEVCDGTTLAACKINDDSKWTDLDKWTTSHAVIETPDP